MPDKFDLMDAEMRMEEMDIRMEKGGDNQDYPEPEICPECGAEMVKMVDSNYEADADGNRGISITWVECPECEYAL